MIIAYLRVSTGGQSLDAQRDAARAAIAPGDPFLIFEEKESGARTDRPELERALAALSPGDVLTVTRLDRLARSTLDLHNILARIAAAGAGFRSLHEPMLDTTTPHGKLLIAILGALAEFERGLIYSRTSEGRARAKAHGVKFGPKPVLSPPQIAEARRRRAEGESPGHIGAILGVSRQTILRATT